MLDTPARQFQTGLGDYSRWAKPDSLVTCDHSLISQTPHMLHKTVKGGSFSLSH